MSHEMQKVEDRALVKDVVVFGFNLLHPKQVEIIEYALNKMPDNDIKALFISDGLLDDAVAEYSRATQSAVISLHEIMVDAVKGSLEEDDGMSLTARCWIGFIYALWHELHHNVALSLARAENMSDEWKNEEEALACEYAEEMTEPTIIECNAEMPGKDDFPLFDRLMQFLVDELKIDPESTWVGTQKERLDEGIVFENKDEIFDSVVEWFKATTRTPEKYERENVGAAMAITHEELPNIFDQKILPGDQANLFPDNSNVAVGAVGADECDESSTRTVSVEQEEHNRMTNEDMSDVEDSMPDEAYYDSTEEAIQAVGGNDGIIPNTEGYTTGVDPFAPNFSAPVINTAETTTAVQQPVASGARDVLIGLYMRMYNHMWTVGVLEQLPLTDVEKELGLVVGCVVANPSGSGWITGDVKQAGYIKGCMYKGGGLPAYDLWINWGGVARHFKMIAQNPDKTSSYAEQARNGAKIVWILEVLQDGTGKFVSKIINGVYSAC